MWSTLLVGAAADLALQNIMSSVNIFSDSPRLWHHYIRKFLALSLNNTQRSIPNFFSQQHHLSIYFMSLEQLPEEMANFSNVTVLDDFDILKRASFNITKLDRKGQTNLTSQRNVSSNDECDFQLRLSEPKSIWRVSGQIQIVDTGEVWCFKTLDHYGLYISKSAYTLCQQIWQFSLDTRLRLNLSLLSLYFSSGASNCNDGSLTLSDPTQQQKSLCFCGHHSLLTVYPGFKTVDLELNVDRLSFLNVKMLFSVFDVDLLNNLPPASRKSTQSHFAEQQACVALTKGLLLMSFSIKVPKHHHISLQAAHITFLDHTVFDGPGYLSAPEKATQHPYRTTSFQCLLQVMIPTNLQTDVKYLVNFTSKQVDNWIQMTTEHTKIVTLPTAGCYGNMCYMNITTDMQMHVNVSVVEVTYVGISNFECDFGGLAAAEILRNELRESLTVCHPVHSRIKRNYYSFGMSLLTILYWYRNYSTMGATLKLSTTACHLVHIDICQLQHFCIVEEPCGPFPESLKHFGNVSLISESYQYHRFLSVDLLDYGCLVLQLFKKKSLHPHEMFFCFFTFKANLSSLSNSHLIVETKGQIKSHTYQSDIDFVRYFGGVLEFYLKYLNASGAFECFYHRTHSLKCSARQQEKNNILFVSYAKVNPMYQDLQLFVASHEYRQSWTDILVERRNTSKFKFEHSLVVIGEPERLSALVDKHHLSHSWPQFDHVLLLKKEPSLTNMTDTHFLGLFIRAEEIFSRNAFLKWKTVFQFAKGRNYYVSLPGKIAEANLFSYKFSLNGSHNYSISVHWLEGNYQPYLHFVDQSLHHCSAYQKSINLTNGYNRICIHLSSNTDVLFVLNNFYDVRFAKTFDSIKQMPRQWKKYMIRMSWITANNWCKTFAGHLPTFASIDRLNEFLALVKLSLHIPPLQRIFIGISENPAQQVKCCLLLFLRLSQFCFW